MKLFFRNIRSSLGYCKDSSKELALFCKQLVTIITDVPLEFNIDEMQIKEKDEKGIKELFAELDLWMYVQP